MPTITVSEKVTGGPARNEFTMDVPVHRLTVRDLIRNCVNYQAELVNSGKNKSPFFAPAPIEEEINATAENKARKVDGDKQFHIACEAFSSKKVLLLLDGSQETELEKEIVIGPDTRITFLQLVPLVGG